MPYYVYKVTAGVTALVKNIELQADFESFKEAKNFAKDKRPEVASEDGSILKIIFAENPLQAEEQLMEKRDAPIIQEWEK
ncbi:MAG: hypothetical protein OQK73_02095 [Gammaproteobacteria bacterium]|nr:hypothetical protein [Gammaproteobacteria bacterium]